MAKAGLGLNLNFSNPQSSIYVPINVTESFRIEPSFDFYIGSNSEKSNRNNTYNQDTSYYAISLGFFGRKPLIQSFYLLYGGRFGYFNQTHEYKSSNQGNSVSNLEEGNYFGTYISPTIGFEYFIIEKLSLGAEFFIVFAESFDNDEWSRSDDDIKVESSSIHTDGSISLKYYF